MVTALEELVRVPDAPLQVVVGAGEVWTLRFAGTVSVKPDWVNAKRFVLLKVMVSVEAAFALTLVGENASVTVGGTGVTVMGVGHAVAAVPAEDGVFTVAAPAAVNDTVPVSMWPAESVTVTVKVPAVLPVGMTLTCGVLAAPWITTPPLADHAYLATLSGVLGVTAVLQAATLALASNVLVPGVVMTAIGSSAALTALSAFTIPAPHWFGPHAHSVDPFDAVHWGTPAGCGNGLALDLMRAISIGGVKFALTARISAAIPETIGAEKLVPRLVFVWSV
jgi:hypothetical protein